MNDALFTFLIFLGLGVLLSRIINAQGNLKNVGKLIVRGQLMTGSVSTNNAWIQVGTPDQKVRVRAERARMGDVTYELMYEALNLKEKPIVEFSGQLVADDNEEKFFMADGFRIVK